MRHYFLRFRAIFDRAINMPDPTTQYFELQGLVLEVTCSAEVAAAVVPILDYHGFQASAGESEEGAGWTVDIKVRHEIDPVPVGAEPAGQHESGLALLRHNGILYLYGENARADVSASGHRLDVQLLREVVDDPKELNPILYFIVTFALLALLQRRSLYAIHGAAVCRGEEQGILFVGYSDTGKSTMTMALVRRGWDYLSDDSIFVHESNETVEALPFRRDFGLDPDADQYFPELAGTDSMQMTDIEKLRVKVDQLFPAQGRERCIPRVIIFPKITDIERSVLSEVGQSEALALLMRQCSFIDTDRDLAAAQMKTLQGLVRQCRLYKLQAGRDLKDDPGSVENLLLPLLDGDPA
ncbi:MAG: hypothetical protein R2832_18385 [Rhodothermales bacterium]